MKKIYKYALASIVGISVSQGAESQDEKTINETTCIGTNTLESDQGDTDHSVANSNAIYFYQLPMEDRLEYIKLLNDFAWDSFETYKEIYSFQTRAINEIPLEGWAHFENFANTMNSGLRNSEYGANYLCNFFIKK